MKRALTRCTQHAGKRGSGSAKFRYLDIERQIHTHVSFASHRISGHSQVTSGSKTFTAPGVSVSAGLGTSFSFPFSGFMLFRVFFFFRGLFLFLVVRLAKAVRTSAGRIVMVVDETTEGYSETTRGLRGGVCTSSSDRLVRDDRDHDRLRLRIVMSLDLKGLGLK